MTLDDETAERIANETWAKRGKRHTVSGEEYVRAGWDARDAEVEELRADLDAAAYRAGQYQARIGAAEAERDAARAEVEELRAWLDILRATRDGNLSAMRERAERAEATLAKLREWAETHSRMAGMTEGYPLAASDALAILGESPTERETPAEEVLSGRIVTASFETGEPWPCGLEDCECPEHDSPAPPKGTYVTVRLDDEEVPVGPWPVKITRVSEARGEVVPDDRA